MELNFERRDFSCLEAALREVRSSEQTQTIVLPDGMPDVGKVLGAWGQCIQRGKEWRGGDIVFTGGMMVWVLYAPEDGSEPRWIDAWVPFSLQWDLPDGTPEGDIRMKSLVRSVDARSVSPRKLLVRAGMGVMAEAWVPKTMAVTEPAEEMPGVELLKSVYPVRLSKEAGEKTFLIDEELSLPDTAPQPDKLCYYRMDVQITDKKVLTGKVVFRGAGKLHVLYHSEEGRYNQFDTEVAFSQYADLGGEYGSDALAEILPEVTSLELDTDDMGRLRLKAGVVAQFLVTDLEPLAVIEDAYCPGRESELQKESLEVPALLDFRQEVLAGECSINGTEGVVADTLFLPDFPRGQRTDTGVELEVPGTVQVLSYGEDGVIQCGTGRWEARQVIAADEQSALWALPCFANVQAIPAAGGIQVKAEVNLGVTASGGLGIPMVTGVCLGESAKPDPGRPSLILRRAGDARLWDIAKSAGSTVSAIRKANNLQSEPAPDQMLLIPVP